MKALTKIWLCLAVLLIACVGAKAQSSCFTYSDDYGVYANYSVSNDGTVIYASTEVDGYGQMNFLSGNGCGSINYGEIYHTPMAVTIITWNNGANSVGGQEFGDAECPDCYLDITNTQSVPFSTTVQYVYNYVGDVHCSFGPTLITVSGLLNLTTGFAGGTYKESGFAAGDTLCVYTLSCLPGTSISCTGANTLFEPAIGNSCEYPGINTNDKWISVDNGVHKFCFGEVTTALTVPGKCW